MTSSKNDILGAGSPESPGVASVRELLPRGSSIQSVADDGQILLELSDGQSHSMRVPLEAVPFLRKTLGGDPRRRECG